MRCTDTKSDTWDERKRGHQPCAPPYHQRLTAERRATRRASGRAAAVAAREASVRSQTAVDYFMDREWSFRNPLRASEFQGRTQVFPVFTEIGALRDRTHDTSHRIMGADTFRSIGAACGRIVKLAFSREAASL